MKLFEIKTPDGRRLRQHYETAVDAGAKLLPGYEVAGEVFLADADGNGGFLSPVKGQTLMGALLEAHGDELLAYLEKNRVP